MHYANGREAKVGDLVVGTAYNTSVKGAHGPQKKVLAGVLVKAHPGSDTCNAEIEWLESTTLPAEAVAIHSLRPHMAVGEAMISVTGTGLRASWRCRDYTHVGALLHVENALAAYGELEPVVTEQPDAI